MADGTDLQKVMETTYQVDLDNRLRDPRRLEALYGSRFYREPATEQLREFCRLANTLLKTPISHVNLISDELAIVVASDPPAESCPVDESYCQHVVGRIDPVLVANSLEDPLVVDNLGTTRNGVRAYLGVPIIVHRQAIGAFCVADMNPRTWSPVDVVMLTQLSAAIVSFQQEAVDA